jgi:cytidine deaminase
LDRETLLKAARSAALNAYAPYSHFRVGAAVVVETPAGEERVVTGANIENSSFGLTLCAERAALAAACMLDGEPAASGAPQARKGRKKSRSPGPVNIGPRVLQVAVACIDVPDDAPAWKRSPCGACRQWLAELAPDAVYYVDGIEKDLRLPDLLPYAFRLDEREDGDGRR